MIAMGFYEMKKNTFLSAIVLVTGLMTLSLDTIAGSAYTLQPGDVLEISIWKEPDLQREVLVRPDGGISFPLVGSIDASNKSVDELNSEIAVKISKFIPDAAVTVSLKQMLGNRIYVLGKVIRPGEYTVIRNVDVLQALSMAGGINPFADGEKIQVLRRGDDGQSAIPFSYKAVEKGDLTQNIVLQPGDTVMVP